MPDPRTAYADLSGAHAGPALSRIERPLLADLLARLGPDAPTLCEGWTTRHLAAHLVLREGMPLDQARNALRGDRAVEQAAAARDFSALVESVRQGPPLLSMFRVPKLEPVLNSLEYFVHHEDVRRAQPTWDRREFPSWANEQLWDGARRFGKLALRRAGVPVRLVRSDTGDEAEIRPGADSAVLEGAPSELVLHLFGRRSVAAVDISGPDHIVAQLTRHDGRS